MTYYFAEVEKAGNLRKAEPLKALTLTGAKREASKKKVFSGTALYIGTSVNEQGFLNNRIAVKEADKWTDEE